MPTEVIVVRALSYLALKQPADVNPVVGSIVMVAALAIYWFLGRRVYPIVFAGASEKRRQTFYAVEKVFIAIWLFFAFAGVVNGIYIFFNQLGH
ncbi:MAG TPA: hypothetical protein VM328_00960 [Fimbriimonadaceae bacterium]|nr:hypothetical protein [Fimbriimonadaceae bacterium]